MTSLNHSLRALLFAVLVAWLPALSAAQSLYFYDHARISATTSTGEQRTSQLFAIDPIKGSLVGGDNFRSPDGNGTPYGWDHFYPGNSVPNPKGEMQFTLDAAGKMLILDLAPRGTPGVWHENRAFHALPATSALWSENHTTGAMPSARSCASTSRRPVQQSRRSTPSPSQA
jgi:hypothetical protein